MRSSIFIFLILILRVGHSQTTIGTLVKNDKTLSVTFLGKEVLSGGTPWLSNSSLLSGSVIQSTISENVLLLSINFNSNTLIRANDFAGLSFRSINNYSTGVALWRYKPWNSWTKPVKVSSLTDLPAWDVQFFYWQQTDGTYGAIVPLSGDGCRTTLGGDHARIGSKASTAADKQFNKPIPTMAVAFGKDPYELFERIYRVALTSMGSSENIQHKKIFPEPLNYIGWCTWNSSAMGKNLNEELLLKGAKSFYDKSFPLGWILIDDGWFQHNGSQLQSFKPSLDKFPNGFKPIIAKLKTDYKLKYVGVWHALNGYWNGIDITSEVGRQFKKELFSWKQYEQVDADNSPEKTYYFIKPESDSLKSFYDQWHRYLKREDVDFIKVDNQLVTERMALNNYPINTLSAAMHKALNASTKANFDNAIINCMDMTAEAYLNFGSTPVARSVEDYFPYEAGENYNLQRGNAAAHVLQGIYNNLYFSQMVFPDLDMFQSHNPNAEYHAIARAINNGPIYITDNIGEQNFDILNALVYADGKVIKSETSLLPTADCLFQVQDASIFKGFSKVNKRGLIGVWNAADADHVKGSISPADVHGLAGNEFAVYEHFSGTVSVVKRTSKINVALGRMKCQLYIVVPVQMDYASFGLVNKYNAAATVLDEKLTRQKVEIILYEGGVFKAYSKAIPKQVAVNGIQTNEYTYDKEILKIDVKSTSGHPVVTITW